MGYIGVITYNIYNPPTNLLLTSWDIQVLWHDALLCRLFNLQIHEHNTSLFSLTEFHEFVGAR